MSTVSTLPSSVMTLGAEPIFHSLMDLSLSQIHEYQTNGRYQNWSASLGSTLISVPFELLAAVENAARIPLIALTLPSEITFTALSIAAQVVGLKTLSNELYAAQKGIPGIVDLFVSAYKVVLYVVGAFFTATLGLINPQLNFDLHATLGLVNFQSPHAKLNRELEAARNDKEALAQNLRDVEEQLTTCRADIETLTTDNQQDALELEEKNRSLASLVRERDDLSAAYDQKVAECNTLEEQKRQVQTALKEVSAKNIALVSTLQETEAQHRQYKQTIGDELKRLNEESEKLKSQVASGAAKPLQRAATMNGNLTSAEQELTRDHLQKNLIAALREKNAAQNQIKELQKQLEQKAPLAEEIEKLKEQLQRQREEQTKVLAQFTAAAVAVEVLTNVLDLAAKSLKGEQIEAVKIEECRKGLTVSPQRVADIAGSLLTSISDANSADSDDESDE